MTYTNPTSSRPLARSVHLLLVLGLCLFARNNAHAQSAWGGGCAPDAPVNVSRACIGVVWPYLYGDFYIDNYWAFPSDSFAEIEICIVGGSCHYKGWTWINFSGHSGVVSHQISGAGEAYTHVRYYKYWGPGDYEVLGDRWSYHQFWDESQ